MRPENWIKWDLDSRSGVAMSVYFGIHGAVGYGYFLVLIEMLYRSETKKLPISDKFLEPLAKYCKLPQNEAKSMLTELIDLGLFGSDERHFWSLRVNTESSKRQAHKLQVTEKRRESISKRWAKIPTSSNTSIQTDTNGIQTDTNGIQTDTNGIQTDTNAYQRERESKILDPSSNPITCGYLKKQSLTSVVSVAVATETAQALIPIKDSEFLRTTPEHLKKILDEFGPALLRQEYSLIDGWISEGLTPNARKFRKPTHDHYLMIRRWLSRATLKKSQDSNESAIQILNRMEKGKQNESHRHGKPARQDQKALPTISDQRVSDRDLD